MTRSAELMIEGTVTMRFLAYEWLPAADSNAALLSITAQHPDATVVDAPLIDGDAPGLG